MRFALESETRDFAASVDALLAKSDLPAVIRAWNDGDTAPGLRVHSRLAETGAFALLVPEELDGMGAGAVEAMAVLEVMGRHALPGPVTETVMVAPRLLGAVGDDAPESAGLICGGTPVTVACPPAWPYAVDTAVAERCLLVTESGVHAGEPGAPLPSVDRARTVSPVTAGAALAGAPVDLDDVLNHGALGTAAQLLGLASAMLRLGVEYAGQRRQFGRVIGEFQALKHKLAEVAVAVEMARPLLWAGAIALDAARAQDAAAANNAAAANGDDAARAAVRDVSAAKVACADAAALAARHVLQVHGGIGYTLEHDLGLYLTKARALRTAWGTPELHRHRILDQLEAGHRGRS